MNIENLVVLVGLAVGTAALGTACAVWYRKQEFGIGGSTLSIVGVVLIGLSIWTGVSFSITGDGLQVELDSLEERLALVAENSSVVSEEVVKLNDAVIQSHAGTSRTLGTPADGRGGTTSAGESGGGRAAVPPDRPTNRRSVGSVDYERLKKSSEQLRALSKVPEKSGS